MLSTTKDRLFASHCLHVYCKCPAGGIKMGCLRPSMGHETATAIVAHHGCQHLLDRKRVLVPCMQ
jgi:hypothetical protein